ncbi:PREDICTED: DENN domain-containing protein 1C isoform X2 [Dinoponera quadriceps]|uniref:DENN domain-containing protein 1C isoform X2 n=1 Tax=Dinoponera quadriceps TaxID=609295 RepID=A0A6P3XSM0_DINQU|nr:PREDICTED: DENN domain-containing protein 1C isoform X2 [Dinoponera quadriceps]
MGSRLRENVKQLFECFCEVAAPVGEKPPWILQKYPNSFSDEEILKSVPKFAYPCEVENLLVQHFSFVLTSIDSKWTFGFCRHDPKTDTALVVLSALPWHETFYKLLNHIASLTSNASGEDLWKFLENLYTCGVPIPGNSISIPLPNSTANFICQSPKQFQLPSIPENRNLTEYYSAVDSHNMMIVFASMLYERRIIFTSKRLSRLSACVQACNALIYPMIWQHIYIPVLPLSLIDYLLAPMPFLIGVPTATLQKVRKSDLGEVVILDADNNTIDSPFQDLESLPQDVVTNLKKALRNRPALLGDGVSRAFLRSLVQLTAGYREALTLQQGERITFNQNAFVESRPSSMQPFLRKMLELQIFQQFIEERLNMLNSGLGFSDEFEMEACSYSAKSSSKFMQQYREWTYTMRKESSAFFRSVKDKANPAVKYAVKSVKDKGKDMKTAYKGLKWKGRSNRSEASMRFHQPRSAPSSPTLDRRPIGFNSPPKSPNGLSATTSYRKELRLRNSNFADTSRKQYSPLSPSSPEESESPPERINIDLMQELRDVIFPNTPPVDRTLKPVRSLDSLRPAWSGHLRHGPPPSIVITNPCEASSTKPILSSFRPFPADDSLKRSNTTPDNTSAAAKPFPFNSLTAKSSKTVKEADKTSLLPVSSTSYDQTADPGRFLHEIHVHDNLMETVANSLSCTRDKDNAKSGEKVSSRDDKFNSQDIFTNTDPTTSIWDSEPFDKTFKTSNFLHEVNENDPFDTSKVFMPTYLQTPLFKSTIPSIPVQFHHPLPHPFNTTSCSAHAKDSPDVPDLIRLDSTNSSDDFDPLLSKSSEFTSTRQMTQSLHLPEMGEGLSNPLYPYFQPLHKSNDKPKTSDNAGDMDLLQAYGIDFNKFSLANGDSSTKSTATACNRSVPDNSINNIDTLDTFSLTLNAPAIKSQNNWTKFE